ncbi:hypothetical protein V8C26DRAFT_430343 [Trichoderma gracile]
MKSFLGQADLVHEVIFGMTAPRGVGGPGRFRGARALSPQDYGFSTLDAEGNSKVDFHEFYVHTRLRLRHHRPLLVLSSSSPRPLLILSSSSPRPLLVLSSSSPRPLLVFGIIFPWGKPSSMPAALRAFFSETICWGL